MRNIIIAYPVKDIALKLRLMLENEGLHVSCVCALGSSALNIAQDMREGIIVCAENLSDMSAANIAEHLPPDFDIVALSKNGTQSYMGNLIYLPLPVNRDEFISTVTILASSTSAFTRRDGDEAEIISNAKVIIMNNMDMTETQAHKYLQNESMKTGKKLVAVAQEIINDFR
ncbi:MAG: ANTAR domain-containing protein [Eubacteriales bacterium]|nr:ANTAR domain-containing protein [Eubacteriales bacterium]